MSAACAGWLLIALADKVKQARKQLPVSPKLGLLYAAIESSERLRADIVDAALERAARRRAGRTSATRPRSMRASR